MYDYRMAKIIRAITGIMPCACCPYPCKAKENSSRSNCVRQWYKILHFFENDGDQQAVLDEVYRLYTQE